MNGDFDYAVISTVFARRSQNLASRPYDLVRGQRAARIDWLSRDVERVPPPASSGGASRFSFVVRLGLQQQQSQGSARARRGIFDTKHIKYTKQLQRTAYTQPGPFLRQPSIPSGSPASAARISSTRRDATAVARPQRWANRRSRRGGATTSLWAPRGNFSRAATSQRRAVAR